MLLFYILLIGYIAAVNLYAFLLVKNLRDRERQSTPDTPLSATEGKKPDAHTAPSEPNEKTTAVKGETGLGKLVLTGALGGAITVYACMFLLKYKRSSLLLMVLMPLLGILNVYIFFLLFKSGFGFWTVR